MWRDMPIGLFFIILLGGCACRSHGAIFTMRAVDGGDGLTLDIPYECQVSRLGPELRVFSPLRERTRSPINITITVQDKTPELKGYRTKDVAERTIHYLVSEEEGGSGGAAMRLRAWLESSGHYIILDSIVQPDSGGDGDFHAEWAILPTLRWKPPG